jgi:hypothetical protein
VLSSISCRMDKRVLSRNNWSIRGQRRARNGWREVVLMRPQWRDRASGVSFLALFARTRLTSNWAYLQREEDVLSERPPIATKRHDPREAGRGGSIPSEAKGKGKLRCCVRKCLKEMSVCAALAAANHILKGAVLK